MPPERPRALRLPTGQGRLLRQNMARMMNALLADIPQQLDGPHFKVESGRIAKSYKEEESKAYAELDALARPGISRCTASPATCWFTLRGKEGHGNDRR